MEIGCILIIDDEEKLRGLLARILSLEGYHVFQAGTAREGLKLLEKESINVVLSDVKLPDGNGVDLAAKIKQLYPTTETIVLTAFGTIGDGVKAMKNGAFDYITKGDDNDKILPLVVRAMEKAALQNKVKQLESKVSKKYNFDNILGNAPIIKKAIELAKKVADTDTTTLLEGETGSGKEVFAQAIHYASARKNDNLVAINCSTLSKELLESELFGHKSGAFTGALKDKKGLFEEAHNGTIFLDEIGEMPLELQAKLLRVLESGTFIKVGDTKEIKVNVRVIAATNKRLHDEIALGSFRSDLYYRLSVFQISLPSLSERVEDIELLANHFIQHFSRTINANVKGMELGFVKAIELHEWKGNIRELKNVIERAMILADKKLLSIDLLPFGFNDSRLSQPCMLHSLADVEQHHIQNVIAHANGNKTKAAKLLGIGLTTLYQKIKDYGL